MGRSCPPDAPTGNLLGSRGSAAYCCAWPLGACAVVLAALAMAGCGSRTGARTEANDPSGRLVLTGASTIAPLAAELARRFESLHPRVRIDVQTGGSSRGIMDARDGTADIGMVSRDLKPDESDLVAVPIARDGIGIIVHRDNPVPALSSDEIVGVYTGKTANWRELGGPDARIVVVNKAEGRSTLELFLNHFGLTNPQIPADVVIGDNEQGIKTVAANPQAIGYVSIGTAEYDIEQGVSIRLLPIDGVAASSRNVAAASYPLARTLHLVTRGAPQGLAREFVAFAASPAADDLVRQHYFVPLSR